MKIADIDTTILNSATKYPSIETFHRIGERGVLCNELTDGFEHDAEYFITEKVDGTNCRIIVDNTGDYIIGSREELLFAKGDRIFNPSMHIVENIRSIADKIASTSVHEEAMRVFYMELYGPSIGKAWRNYCPDSCFGTRVFDASWMPSQESFWNQSRSFYSTWRDGRERSELFWNCGHTNNHLSKRLAGVIEPVPFIGAIRGECIPGCLECDSCRGKSRCENTNSNTLLDTFKWLQAICPKTRANMNGHPSGNAEGVVIRTHNRSTIRKLRFEDYARSIKHDEQASRTKGEKR